MTSLEDLEINVRRYWWWWSRNPTCYLFHIQSVAKVIYLFPTLKSSCISSATGCTLYKHWIVTVILRSGSIWPQISDYTGRRVPCARADLHARDRCFETMLCHNVTVLKNVKFCSSFPLVPGGSGFLLTLLFICFFVLSSVDLRVYFLKQIFIILNNTLYRALTTYTFIL